MNEKITAAAHDAKEMLSSAAHNSRDVVTSAAHNSKDVLATAAHQVGAGSRHLATLGKSIFDKELIRKPAKDDVNVKNAMTSSDKVKVFQHRSFYGFGRSLFWGFEPQQDAKGVGIIIYPGTLVDATAYAPIARRMADGGYHAAIATPPFSFASLDVDLAEAVVDYDGWKDSVKAWAVSGHSQGGAMACAYANMNRDTSLKGVILLASFPGDGEYKLFNGNLSDSNFKVTSIYGTEDGFVPLKKIDDSRDFLPPTTKFVKIEGGNHTQFSYVEKLQTTGDKTDNEANISLEAQQEIICKSMLNSLAQLAF